MLSSYYTIKTFGSHEIILQKSRFITYVDRAETEEEAQQFIQRIKKKHHDATHNCFAYIIGENDEIQKANDDGEPGGTAGIPMLEALKAQKLKNTVAVVTRYFGGVKLGAGGLIRAYRSATAEGVRAVGIVKRSRMQIMHVTIDYTHIGKVESELHESPYIIKAMNYVEHVELAVYVPEEKKEEFVEWMTNITKGEATFEEGGTEYVEENV